MRAPVQVKTLKIDDRDVGARKDQTILEVAREHGIAIPALCHLDGLSDVGACRLCLVQVKGARRLLPACVTHVEEGMEVTTSSETLVRYRRMILELFFSERSHICSLSLIKISCRSGEGLAQWNTWLQRRSVGSPALPFQGAKLLARGERCEPVAWHQSTE